MAGRLLAKGSAPRGLSCSAACIAAAFLCASPSPAGAAGSAGVGSPDESAVAVGARALDYSLTPSTSEPYAVCAPPKPGYAACASIAIPPGVGPRASAGALPATGLEGVVPGYEGGGEEKGWAPKELREAYGIPEAGGSGQTVAIVDAWDDPHANADLKTYREKYKLNPACTEENKCFKKVNQKGEAGNYPKPESKAEEELQSKWDVEISLDVDMVSAVCPECHILLVEANSEELGNLYAAEKEAAEPALGATEISNSWYGQENAEETSDDTYFNHPAIPITAAAGDYGYDKCFEGAGLCYPAASRYVISVGGTQLKKAEKTAERPRGWEETVWDDSGGGCSAYESKRTWQTDWGCSKRTDNDVAAVASPDSPVSLYDSGWRLEGGTSVATPIIAAIEAHASKEAREEGAEAFYRHALFEVTLGDSGLCGDSYLCTAEEGYDGPTGWGTPDLPLEAAVGFHAVTGEPTAVTKTEAKLNGYVDPEGKETTYRFEYGPTTSYGKSSEGAAGAGTTWKSLGSSLSGLEQDRLYHYRILATNSSGTVYGQDRTFATVPWATQSTPKPTETTEERYGGYLYGTSCSSQTACTAVGYYINSSGTKVALGERWNGTEWSVQSALNPTGAKESKLRSVSCTSATICVAVGSYYTKTTGGIPERMTLAERWNGTEWSIQSTPNPVGAKYSEVRLQSVSCTSSSACTAVGSYYSKETEGIPEGLTTLAERWNGTEWAIQSTPTLTGAKQSELQGVSCASTEACVAVGGATVTAGKVGLSERWNGKEWSSTEIAAVADLEGVSCTTSEACTAVKGLAAERWNGKEWTLQSLPNPIGARESDRYGSSGVNAVSCSAAAQCVAVGSLNREGEETGMAEVWNGTEWAAQGVPRPASAVLYGVSCAASTACIAVGSAYGYEYKGSDHTVTLAESATLPSIARPVVETKPATAVGETGATLNGAVNPEGVETKYYFQYGTTEAYGKTTSEVSAGFYRSNLAVSQTVTGLLADTTYHYRIVATNALGTADGPDQVLTTFGSWSSKSVAGPAGSKDTYLTGVSCLSATVCTAVGSYISGTGTEYTLAERWNGTEWTVQTPANPAEAAASWLTGVSCVSTTECIAVGTYENGSGSYDGLAERWNGTSWAIQAAPKEGAPSELDGVSCGSSTSCSAISSAGAAEHWNGTAWAVQSVPDPSGAKWIELRGVSCSSSTACTAVGRYEGTSFPAEPQTLAERWNGTSWTVQSTPNPSETGSSNLLGVSCFSSTSCTAVGWTLGATRMLVDQWNGTEWVIQSTPKPNEGALEAASCLSASACVAVGTNGLTRAERWSGVEWLIQSTPLVTEYTPVPSVSCPTVTFCLAFAHSSGSSTPSALIYN